MTFEESIVVALFTVGLSWLGAWLVAKWSSKQSALDVAEKILANKVLIRKFSERFMAGAGELQQERQQFEIHKSAIEKYFNPTGGGGEALVNTLREVIRGLSPKVIETKGFESWVNSEAPIHAGNLWKHVSHPYFPRSAYLNVWEVAEKIKYFTAYYQHLLDEDQRQDRIDRTKAKLIELIPSFSDENPLPTWLDLYSDLEIAEQTVLASVGRT